MGMCHSPPVKNVTIQTTIVRARPENQLISISDNHQRKSAFRATFAILHGRVRKLLARSRRFVTTRLVAQGCHARCDRTEPDACPAPASPRSPASNFVHYCGKVSFSLVKTDDITACCGVKAAACFRRTPSRRSRARFSRLLSPQRRKNFRRGRGHVHFGDTPGCQRMNQRVHNGWRRADGTSLTRALKAERIGG